MTRETRTFVLWYGNRESASDIVHACVTCKFPERTKAYKKLREKLVTDPNVHRVGITSQLDSPFLHWPQSELK